MSDHFPTILRSVFGILLGIFLLMGCSGCGGCSSGKGINKDRDNPIPERGSETKPPPSDDKW